jgi:hypothetical protein
MKKLSKRETSAARKLLVEQRATVEPTADYPPKPWRLFDKTTEAGLKMIEVAAAEGNRPPRIAALLGLSAKQFGKIMKEANDADPSPERLAFERGDSQNESALFVALNFRATTMNDSESAKFLLRIRGHRESGAAVEIGGPKITFVLPGSYETEAAWNLSKGESAESFTDSRTTKLIREHAKMKNESAAVTDNYLRSIGRNPKDDFVPLLIDCTPQKPTEVDAVAPAEPKAEPRTPKQHPSGPAYSMQDPLHIIR